MQRSQTLAELHSREEFGILFFLEEISKAVYVDYRVVCIIVFIITAGVFSQPTLRSERSLSADAVLYRL